MEGMSKAKLASTWGQNYKVLSCLAESKKENELDSTNNG